MSTVKIAGTDMADVAISGPRVVHRGQSAVWVTVQVLGQFAIHGDVISGQGDKKYPRGWLW